MDRKIIYFKAGEVADFSVDNESYEAFTGELQADVAAGDEFLLEQSRLVLEAAMDGQQPENPDLGRSAVCFIWYYFNNSGRHEPLGDVVIVDETGEGTSIQYVPASAVQLSEVH